MDFAADKKRVKEQRNLRQKLSEDAPESDRLRRLFLKTEEMREISDAKNQEMEQQFKEIQDRLDNSSGFLSHIKRSLENIKFSYQRDIFQLEEAADKNREEIEKQIEQIREHIGNLRTKVKPDEAPKPQNYQEALNDVLSAFQNAAQCSK